MIEPPMRVCEVYAIARERDGAIIYIGASLNLQTRKNCYYNPDVQQAFHSEPHRHVVIEMCVADEQGERERYYVDLARMLRHPLCNKATPRSLDARATTRRKCITGIDLSVCGRYP